MVVSNGKQTLVTQVQVRREIVESAGDFPNSPFVIVPRTLFELAKMMLAESNQTGKHAAGRGRRRLLAERAHPAQRRLHHRRATALEFRMFNGLGHKEKCFEHASDRAFREQGQAGGEAQVQERRYQALLLRYQEDPQNRCQGTAGPAGKDSRRTQQDSQENPFILNNSKPASAGTYNLRRNL